MNGKQPVYVVLVNYNGWADTIECLESVLRSDYGDVRILVVDNASADGSLDKLVEWARGERSLEPIPAGDLRGLTWPPLPKPLKYARATDASLSSLDAATLPTLTFIASAKNLGFAGGNNLALRFLLDAAGAGYAFLVNNDMVVAPSAVSVLVDRLESEPTLGAVGGLILDYGEPHTVQAIGGGRMSHVHGMSYMYGAGQPPERVKAPAALGYLSGGCLLAHLDTLRRVGLMDEGYFLYAEDADWGEVMRDHGYRLGCAVDAVVWHKGSQTIVAGSPFQDYYIVRSSLRFVRKHAPQFMPIAATYSVMRCLMPKVVRGEWGRVRSVLKAYGDYALGRAANGFTSR